MTNKLKNDTELEWSSIVANNSMNRKSIVHGLHYIGDKIGTIIKLAKNLKPNGLLIANLDLANIIVHEVSNSSKEIKRYFKKNNLLYNSRTRILKIEGPKEIEKY